MEGRERLFELELECLDKTGQLLNIAEKLLGKVEAAILIGIFTQTQEVLNELNG